MINKRLFIALPLEPAIAKDIHKKFKTLNLPWEKLKVVPVEQMHATIKFLGDTPLEKIPELIEQLNLVKIKPDFLELEINRCQIFNDRQPKVLSMSIAKNPDLTDIYTQMEQFLFDKGLAHKNVRNFTPHITIARVKKQANFDEFKPFSSWQINKYFNFSYFELIESELTPQGPIHSVLQTFDI